MNKIKLFFIVVLVGFVSVVIYQEMFAVAVPVTDENDIQQIINKLDEMMILPAETPTLAQVSDVTQLQNQPFFENAENGDQVVMYLQSKKAVLYRPKIGKIVEIGPIEMVDTCVKDPLNSACKTTEKAR